MTTFRWLVAILAALGVGAVWWVTNGNIATAADSLELTAAALKGVLGLASIIIIASFLTRKHT